MLLLLLLPAIKASAGASLLSPLRTTCVAAASVIDAGTGAGLLSPA
jgi:hypothetical protein